MLGTLCVQPFSTTNDNYRADADVVNGLKYVIGYGCLISDNNNVKLVCG